MGDAKPPFALPGLEPGLEGARSFTVTPEMTAHAMEAEGLHVLSTPTLGLYLELACVEAVGRLLPPDMITVGSEIAFKHLAGSPVGAEVTCTARLVRVEGRRLVFEVGGTDGLDTVAAGTHERFIADRGRLFARIDEKKARLSGMPESRRG